MPTHSVIPFAPAPASAHADQLDRAGQTVLQLLNKAASVAEENSRNAIQIAQELSHKLRAAEGRIAELEAQAAAYQEHADRAEQWLHRIYTEIEDRFLHQDQKRVGSCSSDAKEASARPPSAGRHCWRAVEARAGQQSLLAVLDRVAGGNHHTGELWLDLLRWALIPRFCDDPNGESAGQHQLQ